MLRAFYILLITFSIAAALLGCDPNPIYRADKDSQDKRHKTVAIPKNVYQTGMCSYYGEKFHGRTTANGEIFDMYALTAAHKKLPFGTVIKVTNLQNGMSITVRVNDRGPFVKGRILDLSYAAAQEVGMIRTGVAKVAIVIVEQK